MLGNGRDLKRSWEEDILGVMEIRGWLYVCEGMTVRATAIEGDG